MSYSQDDYLNLTQNSIDEVLASIQPIRDLAKNWDIDIASCLEEYLNELGHEFPNQDSVLVVNKSDPLNFAKAAIILQNSSSVYSRKVEYLYSLVYRALDEIALHQQQDKSRRGKAANVDEDLEEFLNFDPQQQFLLLDDVLPSAAPNDNGDFQKINLVDSENNRRRRSSLSPWRRVSSSRFSVGATPTQVSGDRSVSAISASANRALMGSLDTTSLRLVEGRWDIREDGLYAFPGRLQRNDNAATTTHVTSPSGLRSPAPHANALRNVQMTFNSNDNESMDEDNDEGGGFMFADDNNDYETEGQPTPRHARKSVTFGTTEVARPFSSLQQRRKKDPWTLLDPHTPDTQKPKPLKVGRTIRLPVGVNLPPSECVTGSRTKRIARKEPKPEPPKPSMQSYAIQTYRATLASASADATDLFPRIPLNGLAFGDEFAYIAKAYTKQKAAEKRELRKVQSATNCAVGALDVEGYENDDENDAGGFPFEYDDVDDNSDDEERGIGGPVLGNTGIISIDDAYKNGAGREDGVDQSGDSTTFEELCRAHIAAFAKGAEKYAAETKLSKRIHQWQQRLVPILEEEENRLAFDIHQYGESVVGQMKNEIQNHQAVVLDEKERTNRVSFRAITRNRQNYDVCRLFLACLSLANAGNVEFVDSTKDGTLLDLELKRADIERPMEMYLAPSLANSASAIS